MPELYPISTASVQTIPPATTEHVQFLNFLYGNQTGYMEICFCNGGPCNQKQFRRDGWYAYTPQTAHQIAHRISTLVAHYGNVYISRSLYTKPIRNRSYALPSPIIFLDDAPAAPSLPYSAIVQTSEHSWHAYYLPDTPADPDTIYELQQRAALALGADKSGIDIEQIVRVPASFNTKHSACFPVHLEQLSGKPYPIAELQAAWSEVILPETIRNTLNWEAYLNWETVNYWLDHINDLLRPNGMPKRLKPHTQSYRVLTGTLTPPSPSEARAFVCKGLILHGYPNEEAAALLLHLCDYGRSETKGLGWLRRDIARLIVKEREKHPAITISPSRQYGTPKPPRPHAVPKKSRARKDRPQKLDAAGYLAWLHEHIDASGYVFLTRKQIAQELGISVPTVDRLERHLRTQGAIERHTAKDRSHSWVVILGTINIPPAPVESPTEEVLSAASICSIPMPQTDAALVLKEEHAGGELPADLQQTSPPPDEAPQPTLTQLVQEAIAACPRRISFSFVRSYIAVYGTWSESLIKCVYQTELKRRREATLRQQILAMNRAELRGYIRGCKGRIKRSHEHDDQSWRYWRIPLDKAQDRLRDLRYVPDRTRVFQTAWC